MVKKMLTLVQVIMLFAHTVEKHLKPAMDMKTFQNCMKKANTRLNALNAKTTSSWNYLVAGIIKPQNERRCRIMTVKEKAVKMRTMTDEELVAYVENRVKKARSEGYNQGYSLRQKDLDNLKDFVIKMYDYVIDIGSAIKDSYYDELMSYFNDLYTIIVRLGRR